jgi:hypothetical protein
VAPDTWLFDSVPMPKMRDPLTVAALPGDGRLLDDDPVVVGGKEDDGVRNLAGLADEGRAARGAGASVVGSSGGVDRPEPGSQGLAPREKQSVGSKPTPRTPLAFHFQGNVLDTEESLRRRPVPWLLARQERPSLLLQG